VFAARHSSACSPLRGEQPQGILRLLANGMNTVYIVGAGASYGDNIEVKDAQHPATPTKPPMIRGFFRRSLLDAIRYEPNQIEKDYPDAFEWIRAQIPRTNGKPVGEPPWDQINLEEVFTAVELRREFESPESDAGARLRIVRNQLVGYITRILGLCTQNAYGELSRALVWRLNGEDSLLTFNWDLLLDEPFTISGCQEPQLDNFVRSRYASTSAEGTDSDHGTGLYLKMHGSLNWFLCTNPKCKFASEIQIDSNLHYCLLRAAGFRANTDIWAVDLGCSHCGSATEPLIVPPLVRKPITDSGIIRSIWGLARNKLQTADRMVLIGFSVPPTDFFVHWLLHSAALDNPAVDVVVVNPLNDPTADGHSLFVERMREIFPYKLNTEFRQFAELDEFAPPRP